VNVELRHRCRQCRGKLPAPTENLHHAFCTRTCHGRFYRHRCLVCEEEMQRKQENQRFKSGHGVCKAEHRRFPHAYDWPKPVKTTTGTSDARDPLKTPVKMGVQEALQERPTFRCLHEWRWGGDPQGGDHSLYDRDGLTLARVVLVNGRYHLRTPIAISRHSWADLEEAKRGGELVALMAMPLESVDPKFEARIRKDNTTPHPMGAPLNREPSQETATASGWKPAGSGADMPDVPEFLRRAP